MFKQIHKQFERAETDLYNLQKEEGFSRYILIRSLGNEHLKDLLKEATGKSIEKGKAEELYCALYNSKISEDQIITYINKKYPEVKKDRLKQT